MNLTATRVVQSSAQRLFPGLSLEQVLIHLLLERAQKNLIKYQTMARQFETKYGEEFTTFRQHILHSEPSFEVEQDYFDWELAVTAAGDMTEEIKNHDA